MKILKLSLIAIVLLQISFYSPDRDFSIRVDATISLDKLEPFWASQIIHATEFLPTEWGRNYVQTLQETGAEQQFIRIYNQPENAIWVDEDGKIFYDWSHFDEMADWNSPIL